MSSVWKKRTKKLSCTKEKKEKKHFCTKEGKTAERGRGRGVEALNVEIQQAMIILWPQNRS